MDGEGDNASDKEGGKNLPVMFLVVMGNVEFTHNKCTVTLIIGSGNGLCPSVCGAVSAAM